MAYQCKHVWILVVLAAAGYGAKPLVKIKDGKLLGSYDEVAQVYAFKGIPYATAPTGPLRWTPPVQEDGWKGVREAKEFGSRCMQGKIFADMIFRDPGPSEDCLTVNVWTPSVSDKTDLPVMFWIHGGGFVAGSSSEPRQDGANLAKRGVVVVSLNYRLGVFGFLAHPELSKESTHHASGDYGLEDMEAALDWVHNNILSFGGDPSKVTIFGESAGSWAVSELMASPLAKGSFARAIGQSGGAFSATSLPMTSLEDAEQAGAKFARDNKAFSLGAMRLMPAEDLLKAALKPGTAGFEPVVDGWFLPDPVPEIYAAGKQAHVPLLAGWNKNEQGTAAQSKATVESFTADAQKKFGERAGDFLKLYPAGNLEEAKESGADLARDQFIAFATWKWIEAQAATGEAPVYRYFFTHVLPAPADVRGAYHSADIEFVFDDLANKDLKWRDEDTQLAKMMASYWTNFAKTGDPNGEGLPKWPVYKAADGYQIMRLDTPAGAMNEEHRARYEFLGAK
jgi:para-nitrobenzyl esterase